MRRGKEACLTSTRITRITKEVKEMKDFKILNSGRVLLPNELSTIEGGEPILCTDDNTYRSCKDPYTYKICTPTPGLVGYSNDGHTEICTKGYLFRSTDNSPDLCGLLTSFTVNPKP